MANKRELGFIGSAMIRTMSIMLSVLVCYAETTPVNFGDINITNKMYTAEQVDELIGGGGGGDFTTNNVVLVNTITNVVTKEEIIFSLWEIYRNGENVTDNIRQPMYIGGEWDCFSMTSEEDPTVQSIPFPDNENQTNLFWYSYINEEQIYYTATRQPSTRNALGLALLTDLPPLTNGIISAATATNIANSATNFLTRAEAEAGYTEWTFEGTHPESGKSYEMQFDTINNAWWLVYSDADPSEDPLAQEFGSADDIEVSFSGEGGFSVTATRHRITPTALSQLTNDVGYVTATITNDLASTNYVDNALTNRPTKAAMDEGWWSEWTTDTPLEEGWKIEWNGSGWFVYSPFACDSIGDENSTHLLWRAGIDWTGNFDLSATRHRVAAPVPTKTSDLTNDSGFLTQHQQLTPVYSQTPTFSEWEFSDGITRNVEGPDRLTEFEYGYYITGGPTAHEIFSSEDEARAATHLTFSNYTANRVRTDIIGYTLGVQTNSVLAATNALISSSITNDLVSTQQMEALDTSYRHFSEPTNINQSVQFVTNAPDNILTIQIPVGHDSTKDWIVYAFFATNVTISIPTNIVWFSSKAPVTNEIPANTMTALYFTQIAEGAYVVSRSTMTPILQGATSTEYARPIDSGARLEYAPSMISPNFSTPTSNEYNNIGFYLVDITSPNPPEGEGVTNTTYVITNNHIDAIYDYGPTNVQQSAKSFIWDLNPNNYVLAMPEEKDLGI